MLNNTELTSNTDNKAFTPKMVRDLLNIDNDRIIGLCKKISLIPKRNSKGQTYFSRDDVKILKRVQDLQLQAQAKAQKVQGHKLSVLPHVSSPASQQAQQPQLPATVVDAKLAQTAVETIEKLNNTLTVLEDNLSNKITSVIDEKLDGMDEVVVELIRAKTENENLRHKLNELNKEIFYLKNNLNAYKPLGFGLYTKQQVDIDIF